MSRSDDIDFTRPLREVLEGLGIELEDGEPNSGMKRWKLNGAMLGAFDAHEAWAILRHYDICGVWSIAIRNGINELYHGYEPPETWTDYLTIGGAA